MTKFNTGNPVGSSDPRDLFDNAVVTDNLVTGAGAAYSDRLGKSRKSWQGMEDEFAAFIAASGYGFVGDYAAGTEITGYNQVVRDTSGEFWRLSGSTALPYITTGAGLPEGGAFVAVGDAALRQELNGPLSSGQGASLVNGAAIYVENVAELEALSLAEGVNVYLTQEGRAGEFVVKTGTPPSDPQKGIYIVLANGNYAERLFEGSVHVEWFGPAATSTVNAITDLGYRSVRLAQSMNADDPLKLKNQTKIESGYCSFTNNIPDGGPFFQHDSDVDGGIVRWFEIGDLVIAPGTGTGNTFEVHGIQHCKFGRIHTVNQKGGFIEFAYFNEFAKLQLQNLQTALKFTGVSQSTDSNFNTISNVTINNWVADGLVIENSRGNVVEVFDAETSQPVAGPALKMFDSSYNIVRSFWSEATSTASTPTLLIDGTTGSDNKGNLVIHVPQIMTPNVGIKVNNSVGTRINDVRLVGCSIGIEETVNSGFVLLTAQFDSCTEDYSLSSNDSIYAQAPNSIVGKTNTNHVVTSEDGGFFGYELKAGSERRYKVTAKSSYDVDVSTGRGNVMRFVDNLAEDASILQTSHSLNFYAAKPASDCPNNTLFRDSVDQKLKYKDNNGTVNVLY